MSQDYGLLINQDTKLHRKYFEEMVRLLGIQVIYRSPLKSGTYTLTGEYISLNYTDPKKVGCIFDSHPTHETAKKLGWNSELIESSAIIHVPYDLDGLQVGCLFEIPSAYDNTPSRLFRVVKLSATMVYPASIACELVPEYLDSLTQSSVEEFITDDFTLLDRGN